MENSKILPNFCACLDNLHSFINSFNPSNIILYLIFIEYPNLDLFSLNEDKCPICYSNIYIPTYIKSCKHIYCLSCIMRWINKRSLCPLCRQKINQIGFFSSESKKKLLLLILGIFK